MEGVGTSPARYLAEAPPVQLSGEGRELSTLREEARKDLGGEFVRVADKEPIAAGQPRDLTVEEDDGEHESNNIETRIQE